MRTRANCRACIGYAIFALIIAIIFNLTAISRHIPAPSPDAFIARWPR